MPIEDIERDINGEAGNRRSGGRFICGRGGERWLGATFGPMDSSFETRSTFPGGKNERSAESGLVATEPRGDQLTFVCLDSR
ncbi:hypothetical protein RRSWK_00044 [Rhodopirellula sp. SWK7]|nr:hypothetical protein RRSWK_00044 [Rhodopirellula sp. SWK7]